MYFAVNCASTSYGNQELLQNLKRKILRNLTRLRQTLRWITSGLRASSVHAPQLFSKDQSHYHPPTYLHICQSDLLPSRFPTKILHAFLNFSVHPTFLVNLAILNLITVTCLQYHFTRVLTDRSDRHSRCENLKSHHASSCTSNH